MESIHPEIEDYEQQLDRLGHDGDALQRAKAHFALSRLYSSRREPELSASDLASSINHATQGLLIIGTAAPQMRAQLLQSRGESECALYDLDGQRVRLQRGVEDLRAATEALRESGSPAALHACSSSLATALVRTGEQQSSIELLREALSMLELLVPQCAVHESGNPDALPLLLSKRAIARLRIGAYSGDSGLVDQAVRDLQDLLRQPDVTQAARATILQNLCATLLENARQYRNERVYRQLLGVLEQSKLQPVKSDRDANLLFFRAQAQTELGGSSRIPDLARKALEDLEELLKWHQDKPASRLTVLHAIAQAHFQLGKLGDGANAAEQFRSCIQATEAALALTQSEHHSVDTRRHRLLADLGSYTHALGITLRDARVIDSALVHFEAALQAIPPEAAPALYAQVAAKPFYLHFSRGRWSQALELFSEMERAWERILADSRLSGAVYGQEIRDLSGQYARAAWCRFELGELEGAAEILDRGRARTLLRMRTSGDENSLSASERSALALAVDELEHARATETDARVLARSQEYLSLRRRLGLDGAIRGLSAGEIAERVPAGGALVQVIMLSDRAALLLSVDKAPDIRAVGLPQDTTRRIDSILNGNAQRGTPDWKTAYERFASSGNRSPIDPWNTAIVDALRVLGGSLMEPLHRALLAAGVEPGAHVVISPPGQLGFLPLSCALLQDGRHFNEAWRVSVASSISSLSASNPAGASMQSHRALILSAGAGSHEPLPYAERESRMVSERFPGSASKVLAQASLRTVISELGNASIVHVCCHGVFEWNEPGLSGLELSDGRLTINNLTSAPAGWPQMCVVFLSSCESGIAGASAVPDEFLGIHTAFLQGGARAAIGTLWAVYDDTAMVFADRFYRYYLDGHSREAMPPSAALSKAQHWLRTVTVRQLLDEGLFEPNEVPVLLHRGNRQSAKLRWPRRSDQTAPVKGTERAPRAVRTSRRILASTPYASPMEWAAFVIMGV